MQPEHLDLHNSYGHHYVTLNLPAVRAAGRVPAEQRDLPPAGPRARPRPPAPARVRRGRWCATCSTATRRARPSITFERLRDEGALRVTIPGVARFAEGGFPTAGGRLRLLAPELAEQGADPLVGYVPPHELEDAELAERFPLALLSPASRHVLNSTFASLPWHRGRLGPPRVHLHPLDAGERGIESGAQRARAQRPRRRSAPRPSSTTPRRPGVAFTYKQQWPQLLGPGEHVNVDDPRARRRPRRQPDVPRQPGADRARSHVSARRRVLQS